MKLLAFLFCFLTWARAAEPKFGPYAEPAFPFLESTVDFRDWEKQGFAKENLVVRGLILKLGGNLYACYDTDLLRLAAVWEGNDAGEFLTFTSIASISYDAAKAKVKSEPGQKDLPKPIGRPITATGRYLGWTQTDAATDPRRAPQDAKELGRGPVPQELGQWLSVTLTDGKPTVSYRIGEQVVTEQFRFNGARQLERVISHWPGKLVQETNGNLQFLDAPKPTSGHHVVAYPESKARDTKAATMHPWSETITLRGVMTPSNTGFEIDDISLPISNPWDRNVRLSGLDFFADGRAAVCTLDGDVWIVSGLAGNLEKVTWQRFAAGLAEPQSIAVVKDEIYVFTRNGIERLRAGADGFCQTYEMFCNGFVQTGETREYPMDMVKKPGGGFYISKGGQQLSHKGDGAGRIFEVSADGKSVTEYASGFRQPYLGIHPKNGTLSASDQQGNFIPTTPIHLVKKGHYYGYPDGAASPTPSQITEATCWIPHEVNQSASGQVWCVDSSLKSLEGHLLHLAYFKSAAFKTLLTPDDSQAAVFQMPWRLDIPVLKGAIHPMDGTVYLCGMQIWGADAAKISGLKRVRQTSTTVPVPTDIRAVQEGMIISFPAPLQASSVAAPGAFMVQRWNYQRTAKYGSAHFKRDGQPGHEFLPVVGTVLSQDGKSVFLRIDDMQPIQQLQIEWKLSSAGDKTFEGLAFKGLADLTIRSLAKFDFAKATIDPAIMSAPAVNAATAEASAVPPALESGKQIAMQMGCLSCHSVDGNMEGMKGPSWKHLLGSEVTLVNGKKVTVNEAYIREAILDPTAKVRKGFNNADIGMPPYAGILSENQISSLLLYFKQLADK